MVTLDIMFDRNKIPRDKSNFIQLENEAIIIVYIDKKKELNKKNVYLRQDST